MKKIILTIMLAVLFTSAHTQTNISAGNVSGTWTKAGSPYKVNGNITIPNGSTLTIEPGVVIQFAQRKYLKVDGRILAQGGAKSTDSIWFTRQLSLDTSSWKGIKFLKTAATNDTSLFKYCVFRNCRNTNDSARAYLSGGITVLGYGKVKIANSTFYSNESSAGACLYIIDNSYAKVQSCTFKSNAASEFYYWDGNFYQGIGGAYGSAIFLNRNSNCIIDSCSFKNNSRGKQYQPNPSINYDASTIHVLGSTFYKQNCYATITNCLFDGNEGITIYSIDRSFVNVSNCNFINAPFGKSLNLVFSEYKCEVTTQNCTFSGNQSTNIFHADGSKIFSNSDVIKNNTNIDALYYAELGSSGVTPYITVNKAKIYNNTYDPAYEFLQGAILVDEIKNSLIANNSTKNLIVAPYVYNNTIVNNYANWVLITSNNTDIYYKNNIIWGNKCDSTKGRQIQIRKNYKGFFNNNLIEKDTANFWLPGIYSSGKPVQYLNNLSTNPQFVNPTTGVGVGYNAATADFSLKSTCAIMSPAINAGSTDTTGLKLPKTDLAGNTRFYENRIDIGAYENTAGAPLISITQQAKNDSLCEKSRPAQLTISAIGKGLSYQWQQSLNGGNTWSDISGQVNAKLSLSNTTTTQNNVWYRAVLTGTCDKDTSLPKQIITHALPAVNLGADTAVCKNSTISKTTPTTGTYLWHTGNTTNTLNQTIKKDSIWWLQITSAQGCKNRDTLRIQSKALPSVNIGADRNLNKNAQLTLDAGAGASSYLWNNGLTSQTRTFYGQDLGAAGAYTLWAQVTGSNGCSARDSIVITVIDNSAIKTINTGGIKLYPQPANDVLNIEVGNNAVGNWQNSKLTISSLEGKILLTQAIDNNQTQVSTADLETGVYIITLSNGIETISLKWVKE